MNLDRLTNFLCSVLFLMISLFFPFFIAIQYHEAIPVKTMNVAIGMYVLTVATSARNLFIFLLLVFCAIDMFATYGAHSQKENFQFYDDMFDMRHMIIYFSSYVGILEKFNTHIREAKQFLPFKYVSKRWEERGDY